VIALSLPGVDTLPPESLRQKALSQWFTPDPDAERLARMAGSPPQGWRVLEPSAGAGALVSAILPVAPGCAVDAIELDPRYATRLESRFVDHRVRVECCDYLRRPAPARRYDLVVENPPYEGGLDSLFLAKTMDESDRVIALVRLALLETQRAYERVWSRVESGEWRLVSLRPFVVRPEFRAGDEESDGGKTAFLAVKMARAEVCSLDAGGTHVEWWT
jgi:predicted RNA methylase